MRNIAISDTFGITWSYSRLTTFEECKYKWLLKYRLNLSGIGQFFAQYGIFIHHILELYLSGRLSGEELYLYYVTHFSEHVTGRPPSRKVLTNYYTQGLEYFKKPPRDASKILYIEHYCEFDFNGNPFCGIIDVILEDDGSITIRDHKSRALKPRSRNGRAKKADAELDKYLRQLYIYSKFVYDKFGKYPEFLEFNCFRTGIIIREPFVIQEYEAAQAWSASVIKDIEENYTWEPSIEYFRCTYLCDVNHHCEYYELFKKGGCQ